MPRSIARRRRSATASPPRKPLGRKIHENRNRENRASPRPSAGRRKSRRSPRGRATGRAGSAAAATEAAAHPGDAPAAAPVRRRLRLSRKSRRRPKFRSEQAVPIARNRVRDRHSRDRCLRLVSGLRISSAGCFVLRPSSSSRRALPDRRRLRPRPPPASRSTSASSRRTVTSSPRVDALGFFGVARDDQRDRDFDFRMQRDGDLVLADGLDRRMQFDLAAGDRKAAFGDEIGDVARAEPSRKAGRLPTPDGSR